MYKLSKYNTALPDSELLTSKEILQGRHGFAEKAMDLPILCTQAREASICHVPSSAGPPRGGAPNAHAAAAEALLARLALRNADSKPSRERGTKGMADDPERRATQRPDNVDPRRQI